MKTILLALACSAAMVTPAFAALKVSNLSADTQTVLFDSAGSVTEHVIAPDRTAYINGSEGLLSLKNAKPTQGDDAIVGTRSSFFGYADTARSQRAPAGPMDEFVIWPDGRLMFQKKQKSGGATH